MIRLGGGGLCRQFIILIEREEWLYRTALRI